MCVNVAGGEEWDVVEESQIGRAKKSLMWWAEEGLVHVLDPILYVRDGVHIVHLMLRRWREW